MFKNCVKAGNLPLFSNFFHARKSRLFFDEKKPTTPILKKSLKTGTGFLLLRKFYNPLLLRRIYYHLSIHPFLRKSLFKLSKLVIKFLLSPHSNRMLNKAGDGMRFIMRKFSRGFAIWRARYASLVLSGAPST